MNAKKVALFGASAVVLAGGLIYALGIYPPASSRDGQGAIGQRSVYRAAQPDDASVNPDAAPVAAGAQSQQVKTPELQNGQMKNGQVVALQNGQMNQMQNGQVVAMQNGQLQNGQVVALQNGQMLQLQNGQMLAVKNGQVVAMQNGQMLALKNGQMVAMKNGQMLLMKNGQLLAVQSGMKNGDMANQMQNGKMF